MKAGIGEERLPGRLPEGGRGPPDDPFFAEKCSGKQFGATARRRERPFRPDECFGLGKGCGQALGRGPCWENFLNHLTGEDLFHLGQLSLS